MIHSNKKKSNPLLNLLFQSKNFYGESMNQTKKDLLPFLYGCRHHYSIINLKYTSLFLKRVFKLIEYTLQKQKKILMIGNSKDIQFLMNTHFTKKNKNILYLNNEWVHGSITNKTMNFFFKQHQISLIFIIKTSVNENYFNKELSVLNVPVISFINTNQSLEKIHYPLVTNSNHIQSLYTLMYLIRKFF